MIKLYNYLKKLIIYNIYYYISSLKSQGDDSYNKFYVEVSSNWALFPNII